MPRRGAARCCTRRAAPDRVDVWISGSCTLELGSTSPTATFSSSSTGRLERISTLLPSTTQVRELAPLARFGRLPVCAMEDAGLSEGDFENQRVQTSRARASVIARWSSPQTAGADSGWPPAILVTVFQLRVVTPGPNSFLGKP